MSISCPETIFFSPKWQDSGCGNFRILTFQEHKLLACQEHLLACQEQLLACQEQLLACQDTSFLGSNMPWWLWEVASGGFIFWKQGSLFKQKPWWLWKAASGGFIFWKQVLGFTSLSCFLDSFRRRKQYCNFSRGPWAQNWAQALLGPFFFLIFWMARGGSLANLRHLANFWVGSKFQLFLERFCFITHLPPDHGGG